MGRRLMLDQGFAENEITFGSNWFARDKMCIKIEKKKGFTSFQIVSEKGIYTKYFFAESELTSSGCDSPSISDRYNAPSDKTLVTI